MATRFSVSDIERAVARAVESANGVGGGERLAPFTRAEVWYIQEVVTRSLAALLADDYRTDDPRG